MNRLLVSPNLSKVTKYSILLDSIEPSEREELFALYDEAVKFLRFYNWCKEIVEGYVGMFYPGIVGVFLFRIEPNQEDVDSWIWVIVGDLPPAYITCDDSPNPATALDSYIGAMNEWVRAAEKGESVADVIPVNIPANPVNATMLAKRLKFLDEKILVKYQGDLIR